MSVAQVSKLWQQARKEMEQGEYEVILDEPFKRCMGRLPWLQRLTKLPRVSVAKAFG